MLFSNFLTFGGHKAVVRPVPIPNTAVKRSLADGSGCIASARVGCRQIFIKEPEHPPVPALFIVRLHHRPESSPKISAIARFPFSGQDGQNTIGYAHLSRSPVAGNLQT